MFAMRSTRLRTACSTSTWPMSLAYVEQPESLADALLTEEGSGVVPCRRGNADLLLETRRYFADSTCTLRRDFSVERTTIVRF
ncbi:hypothetical protein WK53_11395 [Burkholderia ubonensis]|uniref:UbiC transcription regulator-associated domain-containing protein n=1 Tax=Burkholderia ubonensis TaxID=101571 RepID=A0AAW3N8F6_9BURK|nr:hypothetical protein WK53_11395 [Burkholderia ubonensis]